MVKFVLALILLAAIAGAYADADAQTVTYQHYGNTTYGSDGSTAQTYGNQTYVNEPNGTTRVCSTYGNTTYCN